MNGEDELLTVQEFADRYRVDSAVVRLWVKTGRIPFRLVGPSHMQKIRVGDVVKEIGGHNGRQGTTGTVPSGAAEEAAGRDVDGAGRTTEEQEIAGRSRGTAAGASQSRGRRGR